jgi:hypothetical protein
MMSHQITDFSYLKAYGSMKALAFPISSERATEAVNVDMSASAACLICNKSEDIETSLTLIPRLPENKFIGP